MPPHFFTDWENWQPNLHATLLFVIESSNILLIEKQRGLGAGKINGPGGKIDPGETPVEAAVREVEEELLIRPIDPVHTGILYFDFTDGLRMLCHVFRSTRFTGTPTATDEAIPYWSPIDAIPFDKMWEDDRFWLSHLINQQHFRAFFRFDGEKLLHRRVWLLDQVDGVDVPERTPQNG